MDLWIVRVLSVWNGEHDQNILHEILKKIIKINLGDFHNCKKDI